MNVETKSLNLNVNNLYKRFRIKIDYLYRNENMCIKISNFALTLQGVIHSSASPLTSRLLVVFDENIANQDLLLKHINEYVSSKTMIAIYKNNDSNEKIINLNYRNKKHETQNLLTFKNNKYYSYDIEKIQVMFNTDVIHGLTSPEAEKRLKEYGLNIISEKKKRSLLHEILESLNDFSSRLLIGVSIISLLIGQIPEAIAVAGIVLLESALSCYQQHKAEKSIYTLKNMVIDKACVLRDGKKNKVDSRKLVPGDIIFVEAGDKIPADCRIIECFDLKTSEATLNGESSPVVKDITTCEQDIALADRTNMLYMGTSVFSGRAKAVVVCTGMKTEIGKIALMLQNIDCELTPLQIKMQAFVNKLTKICTFACLTIGFFSFLAGRTLVEILTTAVGFSIGAIPESLPAVVTITMALSVQNLAKHNAIVRKLSAVEGLSSTNVICCDKTGTLTMNQMTVKKIFVNNCLYEVTGSGYNPQGEIIFKKGLMHDKNILDKLILCGLLCNNANLKIKDGKWIAEGDPTEGALLTLAYKNNFDVTYIKTIYKRIDEVPFDCSARYMTVIVEGPDGKLALCKGAFSAISKKCSMIYDNGTEKLFNNSDKEKIQSICDEMASNALRVLAFAYKNLDYDNSCEDIENNFVFAGIVGMEDPPREGVLEAIQKCHKNGIKIVMITGDNKNTAAAIGKQLGLLTNGLVVSGSELENIPDEQLDNIIHSVQIFARTSPEQKYKIVKAFKRSGYIVAMTGDGVNDAPAIKEANIGIAMGSAGSDVAKDAASITLVDDNFATIVKAIEEGKRVNAKIRKVMKYLLAGSIGETIAITLTSVMAGGLPFLALQLLWLNVIAETIMGSSLVIADDYNNNYNKYCDYHHYSSNKLIDKKLAKSIALRGIGIGFTTFGIFQCSMLAGMSLQKSRTLAFSNLVTTHIADLYDCRNNKKAPCPLYINATALFSAASLLSMIYIPVFNRIFGTVALTASDWLILASTTFLSRLDEYFLPKSEYMNKRMDIIRISENKDIITLPVPVQETDYYESVSV